MLLPTLLVLTAAPDFEAEIALALADVAPVHPVPANLVRAIIACESNFDPSATSRAGAVGLMQVMPFNASKVGLHETNLQIPRLNVLVGVRLLAVLLKHYDGDIVSALVAYNAGPQPKGAPIPANGETPAYVRCVLERMRSLERRAPAGQ
jgi:soluble lytic murein transglycosylase-like protein